jgi:hypothetical protein
VSAAARRGGRGADLPSASRTGYIGFMHTIGDLTFLRLSSARALALGLLLRLAR